MDGDLNDEATAPSKCIPPSVRSALDSVLPNGHRRKGDGNGRFRGGSAPETPKFDGAQRDTAAFAKYKRKVEMYELLASPYIPKNEMALRMLKEFDGEAADELEPWLDEHGVKYFYDPEGVERLMGILEPAFGEILIRKKTTLITI